MRFVADKLILFGASGDLSQRMLLPSLCALHDDKLIAPELKIIGTARSDFDDESYRNFAREALETFQRSVAQAFGMFEGVVAEGFLGQKQAPARRLDRAANPDLEA